MSSTFSKLLELYVLEECSYHDFSDLQFGFIKGRGTELVIMSIILRTFCSMT